MKNKYQKLPKCYIGKIGVSEISFLENFYYQQDDIKYKKRKRKYESPLNYNIYKRRGDLKWLSI